MISSGQVCRFIVADCSLSFDSVQVVSSFSRGGACCLLFLRSSRRCCCCCPSPLAAACVALVVRLLVLSSVWITGEGSREGLSGDFDGPGCRAECFLVSVRAFRSSRGLCPSVLFLIAFPSPAFFFRRADRLPQGRRVTKQKSGFIPAGPSVVPSVLISADRRQIRGPCVFHCLPCQLFTVNNCLCRYYHVKYCYSLFLPC